MELTLERNCKEFGSDKTGELRSNLAITPALDGEYWIYRVMLSKQQAIIGFKKFFTIGIGFWREEDWNTNLPYTSNAKDIYEHIEHNKKEDSIRDEDCIRAIEMIQEAIKIDMVR